MGTTIRVFVTDGDNHLIVTLLERHPKPPVLEGDPAIGGKFWPRGIPEIPSAKYEVSIDENPDLT